MTREKNLKSDVYGILGAGALVLVGVMTLAGVALAGVVRDDAP